MPSSPDESQVLGNIATQEIQLELPINVANTNLNSNFYKSLLLKAPFTATGTLAGSGFSGIISIREYLNSQTLDYQYSQSVGFYGVIIGLPFILGFFGLLLDIFRPSNPESLRSSSNILEADDRPPSYESIISQQSNFQISTTNDNSQSGFQTSGALLIPSIGSCPNYSSYDSETPPPNYDDVVNMNNLCENALSQ